MLLKEFDIHYHGTKFTDRKERAKIGLQTRCVTALFERCFSMNKFRTDKTWKILVEAVDEVTKPSPRIGDVIVVQEKLDIEAFFRADNLTKKRIALELLFQGIEKVCQQMGWSIAQFRSAYECVVQHDYANEWTHGKPKRSPSKEHWAEIYCILDVEAFRMYLLLRDSSRQETRRILLKEEIPSEFVFASQLGRLQWISDAEIVVGSKDRKAHWLVDITKNSAS